MIYTKIGGKKIDYPQLRGDFKKGAEDFGKQINQRTSNKNHPLGNYGEGGVKIIGQSKGLQTFHPQGGVVLFGQKKGLKLNK